LLLLLAIVWLSWPDRNLARAKDLQKQLFNPAARSMSAEQRRQKWQEFREAQRELSPAQQAQLFAESRETRRREMSRYFRLSPKEKTRYLDDMIKRSEQMRQSRQAAGGRGPGGQGGTNRGGQGANGQAGNSTAQGNRAPANSREERRQRFLDSSNPAERAMFTEFRKELSARRAQLGLPPSSRGFGPPR